MWSGLGVRLVGLCGLLQGKPRELPWVAEVRRRIMRLDPHGGHGVSRAGIVVVPRIFFQIFSAALGTLSLNPLRATERSVAIFSLLRNGRR